MSYTLISIAATVVAIIAAAFFFSNVVWPLAIYVYTYIREGRSAAEEKALDAMGENKLSYGLKGSFGWTTPSARTQLTTVQTSSSALILRTTRASTTCRIL